MAKKLRKLVKPSTANTTEIQRELRRVDSYLDNEDFESAAEKLVDLNRRYPANISLLTETLAYAIEMEDAQLSEDTACKVLDLKPDHPIALGVLGHAHFEADRNVLALKAFKRLIEVDTKSELSSEARTMVRDLEPDVEEALASMGFPHNERYELGALYEEGCWLLDRGQFDEALVKLEHLLERIPGSYVALNTISYIYFVQGKLQDAIATCRQVITGDPGDIHALANLVRYELIDGNVQEAERIAGILKSSRRSEHGKYLKIAEALSYLGDDQGVLQIYKKAKSSRDEGSLEDPFFHHFAAVAAYRLGKEDLADRYWDAGLMLDPDFELIGANFADLDKIAFLRHAPWAFPLFNWMSQQAVSDFVEIQSDLVDGDEEANKQLLAEYFEQHEELIHVIPALLDRGDPMGRSLAFEIASTVRRPDMLEALRHFASSNRGPDSFRLDAAAILEEQGIALKRPVRTWADTVFSRFFRDKFEISDEITNPAPPTVDELLVEGEDAMLANDLTRAEEAFKKVAELEPTHPAGLNNLAMVYDLQGRHQQSRDLLEEVHSRFPDYLFARTSLAMKLVHDGKLQEARDMIKPLLARVQFHPSELRALTLARIEIALAAGKPGQAESHLQTYGRLLPNDVYLNTLRERILKYRRLARIPKGQQSLPGIEED